MSTPLRFGDPVSIAQAKPLRGFAAQRARMVALGRHPTGRALAGGDHAGAGHTCGDCAHHYVRRFASTYHKCDLVPPTSGPATDIRVGWPACDRWEREGQDGR